MTTFGSVTEAVNHAASMLESEFVNLSVEGNGVSGWRAGGQRGVDDVSIVWCERHDRIFTVLSRPSLTATTGYETITFTPDSITQFDTIARAFLRFREGSL